MTTGILKVDNYTDLAGTADAQDRVLLARKNIAPEVGDTYLGVALPTTAYDHLELQFRGARLDVDNRQLWLNVTDDAFTTLETTASYNWWTQAIRETGSNRQNDATDGTECRLVSADIGTTSAARPAVTSGRLKIYDAHDALKFTKFDWDALYVDSNGASAEQLGHTRGQGVYKVASQINGIALSYELGTDIIDQLEYSLWGVTA